MFRTTDIVLIAVMVAAAAFTFKIKSEAEDRYAAVRKLEAQIRFEEETTDLLKADWSLLTQPARLQKLSEIYQSELNLRPVEATQIVGPEELPERPADLDRPSTEGPAGLAGAGADATTTGSIVR